MANSKVIPGKLLLATSGGTAFDCQQDATLTITYNLTQEDPCKPDPTETYKGFSWQTSTTDSASWEISFTLKATDANSSNQNSILDTLVNTGNEMSITFETSTATGTGLEYASVFEGDGLISSFTWNAPSTGESTVDVTVTGNGAPTFETVPTTT